MIHWNKIERSLAADYRTTFRLMMREARYWIICSESLLLIVHKNCIFRSKYGTDIVIKIYDNGETCLHTAINKAEEASIESS